MPNAIAMTCGAGCGVGVLWQSFAAVSDPHPIPSPQGGGEEFAAIIVAPGIFQATSEAGSIREFPEIRENNREFCELEAHWAVAGEKFRSNFNTLYVNSLVVCNREFFVPNRELIRRNREFRPPIGFMEAVCRLAESVSAQ
jgi:hypothetical protein